jgi:hypothetical protein
MVVSPSVHHARPLGRDGECFVVFAEHQSTFVEPWAIAYRLLFVLAAGAVIVVSPYTTILSMMAKLD